MVILFEYFDCNYTFVTLEFDGTCWPSVKKPDFDDFLTFVKDNITRNWNLIAAPEDELDSNITVFKEMFPTECNRLTGKKRWWPEDIVSILISSFCDGRDSFFFDWEKSQKARDGLTIIKHFPGWVAGRPFKAYCSYNVENAHWVLLIFELVESTLCVKICDSFAAFNKSSQEMLMVVNAVKKVLGVVNVELSNLYEKKIQNDGYNCGPWIVHAAYHAQASSTTSIDSIVEFKQLCKDNIFRWFGQWLEQITENVWFAVGVEKGSQDVDEMYFARKVSKIIVPFGCCRPEAQEGRVPVRDMMLKSGDILVHDTTKGKFKLGMATLLGTLILYLSNVRDGNSEAIFVRQISKDLKPYSREQN